MNNLGVVLDNNGRIDGAISRAIKFDDKAVFYKKLGVSYCKKRCKAIKLGKNGEAKKFYLKAD
jgi:hypothetical protein